MQRPVPKFPVLILVGTFAVSASILVLRTRFADATPAPARATHADCGGPDCGEPGAPAETRPRSAGVGD